MDIELIKRMMDACYQGKRIRDMLPPLPDGVASSFIQYLDIIEKLEKQGIRVKISDVSDALSLPRPGVTRTVKDMEAKGYVKKLASAEDGRITYLTVTEAGKALSEKYNKSLRKESKVVQTKKQYGDFSLTALSFASISIFSG